MKKYVLDTNLYIRAARDHAFGAELIQFSERVLPQLYLHAIVVQELYTGAINEGARRYVDRKVAEPFERRGRIVTPSYEAWKRSGEIVASLVEQKLMTLGGVPRSFMNDAVLAASCRESGLILVTFNESDFKRIGGVERVNFTLPWPRLDTA